MKQVDFGEDIDTSETRKDRLKRYYNEAAINAGFKDIEEFYVKTKFTLALKGELDTADKNLNELLKTIAQDMGYGTASKEYVMENNLPSVAGKSIIGK